MIVNKTKEVYPDTPVLQHEKVEFKEDFAGNTMAVITWIEQNPIT